MNAEESRISAESGSEREQNQHLASEESRRVLTILTNTKNQMNLVEPMIHSEEHSKLAWEIADEHTLRFQKYQEQYDSPPEDTVELCWQDIEAVDSFLGSGTFSDVYKVRVSHTGFEESSYALKYLNCRSTKNFERDFIPNVVNMALEAAILSSLHHENIIRLQATNSITDPCANRGQFLILELLEETLKVRLVRFRSALSRPFSSLKNACSILERVQTSAIGIARGMKYLHENNIILRDLKPDNVGFDATGAVKLFDFGLARHVEDDCSKHEIAGSFRYMAPETMLALGSGKKSDVYSFGVLMFELCTLQKAFEFRKISLLQFKEKVSVGKYRPAVKPLHSVNLERIVRESWSHNSESRPSFPRICELLDDAVVELTTRAQESKPRSSYKMTLGATRRKYTSSSSLKHTTSLPLEVFDAGAEQGRPTHFCKRASLAASSKLKNTARENQSEGTSIASDSSLQLSLSWLSTFLQKTAK
jgi:serine/threonine protein kinase